MPSKHLAEADRAIRLESQPLVEADGLTIPLDYPEYDLSRTAAAESCQRREQERLADPEAPHVRADVDGHHLPDRLRQHILIPARPEAHEAGDAPVHFRDEGGR